ncbi:MAG: amidohydrolase family protein [Acidobacteriota bacterium]|nr:amidohydrolase family protein [Acidobacteriota bacterium]
MAARLTTFVIAGIIGLTVIAGLIVGAQRDDDGLVDLIVHNAVVFTGDVEADMPEAVAVRGNQILKVGSNREILRMQRPQTLTIDAKGAAVVPGFNDAHLHLVRGGLTLDTADLSGVTTVAEAVARLQEWTADHADRPWIVGRGFDPSILEADERLAKTALDEAFGKRPVQVTSGDGSIAWVNSAALAQAKIGRTTADPEGGRIVRTAKGEATGILEGSAVQRVRALLPEPTSQDRTRALFAAIAEAQRNGITSLQNADGEALDFELLDAARKQGAVSMRVYSALPINSARTDEDVASLDEVLKRYPDDPLFKAGAARVATDGIDRDALNKLVRLLDSRGWQVMIEADDTGEAERARAAFVHAERSNGKSSRERRHRLEHQRRHFTAVGDKLALGSDWPEGPLSPLEVLDSAGPTLTLEKALQAYTVNGAYASYDEQRKGFLKAGMLADIAILSENIFAIAPERLTSVKVAYTIFDGRVVYPTKAARSFTN